MSSIKAAACYRDEVEDIFYTREQLRFGLLASAVFLLAWQVILGPNPLKTAQNRHISANLGPKWTKNTTFRGKLGK